MAIIVKSQSQIDKMKISGEIVAKVFQLVEKHIEIGMTTEALDKLAEDFIRSHDAIPSFKNYNGFPSSLCISINEEITHGMPSKRKIKDGDVVCVDVGVLKDGFHGDATRTFMMGNVPEEHRKLVKVTEESFFKGIEYAKEGCYLNQIGTNIQKHVEAHGYSVVREYIGHGIGRNLHEAPEIPNYDTGRKGPRLKKGMTLAIEPMINLGKRFIDHKDDGWTVVTKDGSCSVQYENTIAITDNEPIILTML